MEKLSVEILDITQENINKIKELFPNVVTEGKIDFEKLKNILGEEIDEKQEKYQFTWNGKRDAIRLAQMPSTGTLRPDKESSKDWDTTKNLYIEGDNLEVLKLLQKSYYGKIKMIYIDPPYNTGGDFVYKDNFKDSIKNYKEQTQQTNQSNPETSGRYHTDWLNMMYPRLMLARNLLTDDGVIFISIDDNELENLKKVCNEIFGESNYIDNLIWQKLYGLKNDSKWFSHSHDYIVVFAKNKNMWFPNLLPRTDEANSRYKNYDNDIRGPWKSADFTAVGESKNSIYEITTPSGKKVYPPKGKRWIVNYESFIDLDKDNRIWYGKNGDNVPSIKRFLCEVQNGLKQATILPYSEVGHSDAANKEIKSLFGFSAFDYPKPIELLKRLLLLSTKDEDIVLDFFSGSATTANSLLKLNFEDSGKRKFIMVQLPELLNEESEAFKNGYKTICDIGKERIRRSGNQIIEGTKKEDNLFDINNQKVMLDIGFKVFKLDNTNFNTYDSKSSSFEDLLVENTFDLERSNLDILYEIMLKFGAFDKPVETLDFDGKKIFSVALNYMLVVIDEILDEKDINKIIELKPQVVIFDERCFKDDNAKMNIDIRLKAAGIKEVKSI